MSAPLIPQEPGTVCDPAPGTPDGAILEAALAELLPRLKAGARDSSARAQWQSLLCALPWSAAVLPWLQRLRQAIGDSPTADNPLVAPLVDSCLERLSAPALAAAPEIAVMVAQLAIELQPQRADLGGWLATHLLAAGRFSTAVATAAATLEREPREHRSLLVLARRASESGRFAEALRLSRRALAAAPLASGPLLFLATFLRERGRPAAAVRVLQRALTQTPDWPELLNHLGLAQRAANQPEHALTSFRRAAHDHGTNPWAETNLAFSFLRDSGVWAPATFAPLAAAGARPEIGLGLFCDRFPHTYGFLIQQFATYLEHFPDSQVYSFGRRVLEPYDRDQFAPALARFGDFWPELGSRVAQLVPELSHPRALAESTHVRLTLAPGSRFRRPRLAHCVFAMNADLFRPLFETLEIPFSFTLNPGGAFRLGQAYSDERLRQVFRSRWFRHVIVTYERTRDYIRERFAVPEEQISLIHGTIVLERLIEAHRRPKRRYGQDKDTLDLCFAGMRYSASGSDKGYDSFIACAHRLAPRWPHLRFHVVGNFSPRIIDVSALGERIIFHGVRDQRWMAGFFSGIDAVVSPNRPHQLARGAFDGFPVTTCIEAAMVGVALFASDPLRLNRGLTDGVDFVEVSPEPETLAEQLGRWLADPERLYQLAARGEQRCHEIWGEAAQMPPRLALMRRLLEAEG